MTKQNLNIDDVKYQAWEHGDRFKAQLVTDRSPKAGGFRRIS